MATTDIGRAVPLLRGEYDPAQTYELNDIVSLNGSLYWHYSHEVTTNVAPQATSTWKIVLSLTDAEAYIARAESAAEEAESAKDDAVTAKTAAETASTTATGASEAATAAKDDAVTARNAAQTAETGAVEAKNAAVSAKEAAQSAASSAGTSATNASNSAGTAEYYAENAETAAETATTKASEASASATTASSAATTATEAKNTAVSSASTATTKAGEASTSATSAASSAAAAQAVKDSIPEDYSELSEDVGELKTHIHDLDNKKVNKSNSFDLVWTTGKRVSPSGTIETSTNASATEDYYPIKAGETLELYMYAPGIADVVAVYDTGKVFIESFKVRERTKLPILYNVAQDGFIRFSNENAVIPNDNAFCRKVTDELSGEEIRNVLEIKANNTNKIELDWVDGVYIDVDGDFVSSQSGNSCATRMYTRVSEGDVLKMHLANSGAAYVALYDTNRIKTSVFHVDAMQEDYQYVVPQDGYMRFTTDVRYIDTNDAYVIKTTGFSSIEDIEKEIDDIKSAIGINDDDTYTHTITGVMNYLPNGISNVSTVPDTGTTIIGHNLLDTSKYKADKIRNDSGTEINDSTSFYYDCLIPVKNVYKIFTSVPIQRFYYYDAGKNWLGRSSPISGNYQNYNIPLVSNLAYIAIQVSRQAFTGNPLDRVVSLDGNFEYSEYKTNQNGIFYDEGCIIFNSNFTDVEVTYTDKRAFCIPDFWEPTTADTGYSMPIALDQALRSNWTATDKYHYYDFLSAKLDKYVHDYVDGYTVTKRFLGQDSKKTGYELAEYTFSPKNPKYTVLISSCMNSNEIVTVWGACRLIEAMMDGDNDYLTALKNTTKLVFLPFICPSSFDEEPMYYYNSNGIRINKNFNYITSWEQITGASNPKGDYPDSEIETQILKEWVNDYAYIADLWVDCHSDHTPMSSNQHRICYVFTSDDGTLSYISLAEQKIKDHYVSLGTADYLTDNVYASVDTGSYPKTRYGFNMCGIPSIMIEQTVGTTIYGSDGSTINDQYGIKNYAAMLYMFICTMLAKS